MTHKQLLNAERLRHKKFREEAAEFKAYVGALEDQRNRLLNDLRDLAVGLVPNEVTDSWSYATKLQYAAAKAIRREAATKMPGKNWLYL